MNTTPAPEIRPIFILSLPRTGSTLLQRILGSHESIGTASEPWFLLPLLYSMREKGAFAEYPHEVMAQGVRGFAEAYLPKGLAAYEEGIRDLALRLYREAAPGKLYFLDKTPRYHHVANDLFRLFPEGRFIFLWRHPLAVAASMIDAFGGGTWNLDGFAADLFEGLDQLISARETHRESSIEVRYEDLVAHPDREIARLLRYLELPDDRTLASRFIDLEMRNPRYWDHTGTTRYRNVSLESLETWKSTMTNPLRRAWCRRYLRWIGRERLALMGYSLDDLVAEVEALPHSLRRLGPDVLSAYGGLRRRRLYSRMLSKPLPLWPLPA